VRYLEHTSLAETPMSTGIAACQVRYRQKMETVNKNQEFPVFILEIC